ncbi:MAG TPA: (2Fe-2S) ferredoxin domain-containing protein [Planctomycetota bacterium]|nr:(2Fe-2S) ferredoxin domain-containing protein [Planctomycetota bacterium]
METRAAPYERVIFVCCNEREPGEDACANRGSAALQKELKAIVKEKGLKGRVRVSRAMCFGLCSEGPNICVMPDNVWYRGVGPADLPAIIAKHVEPLEGPPPGPR